MHTYYCLLECRRPAIILVRPNEPLPILDIYCKKFEIANISVWNFASNNMSETRGKWFDVTENVKGNFPVTNSSVVSFQDLQMLFFRYCFEKNHVHSWHLLIQIQPWNHQNNVWKLFKINNKVTRTTSNTGFFLVNK